MFGRVYPGNLLRPRQPDAVLTCYESPAQEYIENENSRLEKEHQFWAKEIIVRMEYKYCPNLSIIDTPGGLLAQFLAQVAKQCNAIFCAHKVSPQPLYHRHPGCACWYGELCSNRQFCLAAPCDVVFGAAAHWDCRLGTSCIKGGSTLHEWITLAYCSVQMLAQA